MARVRFVCFILPLATCVFAWRKGVVFGGGEWSASGAGFGSQSATLALEALAATGADHVRILTTQFQTYINSTTIFPIPPPSSLASETIDRVIQTIRAAHGLGLSVLLAPILDPSWDVVTNGRSATPPEGATPVSRLQIGDGFSEGDWVDWFASYTAYIMPLGKDMRCQSTMKIIQAHVRLMPCALQQALPPLRASRCLRLRASWMSH